MTSSPIGPRTPRAQGTHADIPPGRQGRAAVALGASMLSFAATVVLGVVIAFWFGWMCGPHSSWHQEPRASTYQQLAAVMMALPSLVGVIGFALTRKIGSTDDGRGIANVALGLALAGAVLLPAVALGLIALQHSDCR